MKKALNDVAPIKRKRLKDPLERWWNDETQKAYDDWQEARAKPNKSRSDIKKVSDLKRIFAKIRKFRKRKVKREFYTNCNTPKLISKLEKSVRSQPRHQISLMKREDGTFTSNLDESLDLILNKCFPGCEEYDIRKDEEWNNINDLSKVKGLIYRQTFPFITIYRIKEAFRNTQPHKAAGPDQI